MRKFIWDNSLVEHPIACYAVPCASIMQSLRYVKVNLDPLLSWKLNLFSTVQHLY